MSTATQTEEELAGETGQLLDTETGRDPAGPPATAPEPEPEEEGHDREPTKYRILWAPVPETKAELPHYREIRNPRTFHAGGWYEATDPRRARRLAFEDPDTEERTAILAAAQGRGVLLRSVPLSSWGPDRPKPIKTKLSTDWGELG